MLILKSLSRGPMHGYGIAEHIHHMSEDVLEVEEGSLYPGLRRLLIQGWVSAEWGQSENNRRARFYRMTAAGRKQLERELSEFLRVIRAISRVIKAA
jgi:PadR family transcriptional regulator PadR